MYQTNTVYTSNFYNVIWQLYLNKNNNYEKINWLKMQKKKTHKLKNLKKKKDSGDVDRVPLVLQILSRSLDFFQKHWKLSIWNRKVRWFHLHLKITLGQENSEDGWKFSPLWENWHKKKMVKITFLKTLGVNQRFIASGEGCSRKTVESEQQGSWHFNLLYSHPLLP